MARDQLRDLQYSLLKSQNGLNDNKGPENQYYTKVKYGEIFTAVHDTNTSRSEDV